MGTMVLCEKKICDRVYYAGRGSGFVGSFRAYYTPNLPVICYKYGNSLLPYSQEIKNLMEHLQLLFPNQRAMNGLCENSRRIYSCSKDSLREYGFHFSYENASFYVRLSKSGEFNIFAYTETEENNG